MIHTSSYILLCIQLSRFLHSIKHVDKAPPNFIFLHILLKFVTIKQCYYNKLCVPSTWPHPHPGQYMYEGTEDKVIEIDALGLIRYVSTYRIILTNTMLCIVALHNHNIILDSVSSFFFLRIDCNSRPSPVQDAVILLSCLCLLLHDPKMNFWWEIASLHSLVLHHVRQVFV